MTTNTPNPGPKYTLRGALENIIRRFESQSHDGETAWAMASDARSALRDNPELAQGGDKAREAEVLWRNSEPFGLVANLGRDMLKMTGMEIVHMREVTPESQTAKPAESQAEGKSGPDCTCRILSVGPNGGPHGNGHAEYCEWGRVNAKRPEQYPTRQEISDIIYQETDANRSDSDDAARSIKALFIPYLREPGAQVENKP